MVQWRRVGCRACIVAEDDGAYFVEDLTESEALSNNIAAKEYEEEEWDAEASFPMEVRDPNTYTWFIVFEYDDGEDWETPSYKEYGADTEGALTIHEDLKTRDELMKLLEGYSCEDLRNDNMSRAQVILPS